jgi:hypothetical protein
MARPVFVLCVVALAACGLAACGRSSGPKPPARGDAAAGAGADATPPGAAGAGGSEVDAADDLGLDGLAPSAEAGGDGGTDGAADATEARDGPSPILVPYGALAVAVGDTFACALRDDGSVFCWGKDVPMVTLPPGRTVKVLAAGGHVACVILDDGSVPCWSIDVNSAITTPKPLDLPAGRRATQLVMSRQMSCAVLDDQTVFCNTPPPAKQLIKPPAGAAAIRQIAIGYTYELSALYEDGTYSPPVPEALVGRYLLNGQYLVDQIAATPGEIDYWCWERRGGGTFCPQGAYNVSPDPTLPLVQIVVGTNELCGIKTDGGVRCWGTSLNGCLEGDPSLSYWCDGKTSDTHAHDVLLGAPAVSLAVGTGLPNYVCAVLADGSVRCWGGSLDCFSTMPCTAPANPDPILGASVEVVAGSPRAFGAWHAIDLGSHPLGAEP